MPALTLPILQCLVEKSQVNLDSLIINKYVRNLGIVTFSM